MNTIMQPIINTDAPLAWQPGETRELHGRIGPAIIEIRLRQLSLFHWSIYFAAPGFTIDPPFSADGSLTPELAVRNGLRDLRAQLDEAGHRYWRMQINCWVYRQNFTVFPKGIRNLRPINPQFTPRIRIFRPQLVAA